MKTKNDAAMIRGAAFSHLSSVTVETKGGAEVTSEGERMVMLPLFGSITAVAGGGYFRDGQTTPWFGSTLFIPLYANF